MIDFWSPSDWNVEPADNLEAEILDFKNLVHGGGRKQVSSLPNLPAGVCLKLNFTRHSKNPILRWHCHIGQGDVQSQGDGTLPRSRDVWQRAERDPRHSL